MLSPIHRRICDSCKSSYQAFAVDRHTGKFVRLLFGFCRECSRKLGSLPLKHLLQS